MNRLQKLKLSVLAVVVLVGGLPALAAAAPEPPASRGAEIGTPAAPAVPPSVEPNPTLDAPAPPPTPDLTEKEGWTELSHWRRNPDGSTTRDLFSTPQFRPGAGGWSSVDPTVKATTKGGAVAAAEGAVRPIRFGADASKLVQLELDRGPVTMSAPGLDVSRPRVSGTGVAYADVAPDTDLRYAVGASGLKEELVLRSAKSPQQFRFHLSDPAGQLGAVHEQPDGSFRFDGKVGSDLVVVLPAPIAYQEPKADQLVAPAPNAPASAHMTVIPGGDGFDITVAVDAEWARDKAFPIVLDPTVVFQPDAASAKEGQVSAAPSNQVRPAGILLQTATDTQSVLRGAIAFDTSSIPPSSTISSASLSLYWDGYCLLTNSGMCYGQSYNRSYTINAHRITSDAWFGMVTPGSGSTAYAVPFDPTVAASTSPRANTTTAQNHPSGWDSWNVTGLVQGWTNAQYPNNGVLLKLANEALDQSGPAYETSQAFHTNDPATRPKLTVTYTASNKPYAPDQLSPNAARFTTPPALQARYRDFSGLAGQVFFEVRNGAGAVVASAWSAQVASGATASWTPPALVDGTYSWRAQAYNGGGTSLWSASANFALAQAPAADIGLGTQRHHSFEGIGLTDRMSLQVNVANGNVVVQANDLSVAGTGLGLTVGRSYNAQSASAYNLGRGWVMGTGRDVGLSASPNGAQLFEGPSGERVSFGRNPDGSYTAPTAIDATLIRNPDASFALSFQPSGQMLNFSPGGYLTSMADRNGNRIAFAYSSASQLASITDTQGRASTFTYNAAGHIATTVDPSGRTVRYAYDGSGDLTTVTDTAGGVSTFTYSGAGGRLGQISDPLGRLTKLAYDGGGRLVSLIRVTNVAAGTGPTATYAYSAASTVVTDANGHTRTFAYDSTGRVTRGTDALGNSTDAVYTANSDLAEMTDATGGRSIFGYDARNMVSTATTPTGSTQSWAYADSANPYLPTSSTNAQNRMTTSTYDARGNRTSIRNQLATQNTDTFSYNPNGTLSIATDARGYVTTYGYDDAGNRTLIRPPAALGATTIAYDGLSRPVTVTDGKEQTTTFTYDALDRVTRQTFAGGASVASTYDAAGQLTRRDDGAGVTTFSYDALGRSTTKTTGGITITSTYDPGGNVISVADPGGTVTYAYGAADHLVSLTDPGAKTTNFGHDAAGRRTTTAYPNGVTQTVVYDASGRPTAISARTASGPLITDFTYSYADAASGVDRALRTRETVGTATRDYTYDAADRLVEARTSDSGNYLYSFDGAGNRLSQTVGSITTNYAYNAADQLTSAGSTAYTYDANGNLTTEAGGRTFTYNSADQTTSVKMAGLLSQPVAMTYAGAGQVERTKAGTTSFTSGAFGVAIASDAQLLGSVSTYHTRDPDGTLVSQRSGTANHYYLFDALGSVVALTDATGGVANRYTYDPYGNPIAAGTTEAVANRWQYAGGERDASGLYHFGDRYYDPTVGRFTQLDPVEGGSANGYDYCAGDPINCDDLAGRAGKKPQEKQLSGEEQAALDAKAKGEPYDEKIFNRARDKEVFNEKIRQERNVQKRQSNFSRLRGAFEQGARNAAKVAVVVVVVAGAAVASARTVAFSP